MSPSQKSDTNTKFAKYKVTLNHNTYLRVTKYEVTKIRGTKVMFSYLKVIK